LGAWTLRSGYQIIGRAYLRVSEITSTHPFPSPVQAAAAVLEAWTLRSGYPIIGRAYLRVSEITSTHSFPCSAGCCGGIGGVDAEKRLPDYRESLSPCF